MLIQRIVTALVLLPFVILSILFLPGPYFMALTTLITLLAAWEWARLSGCIKTITHILYTLVILLTLFLPLQSLWFTSIFSLKIWAFTVIIYWLFLFIYIVSIRTKEKLPQWPVGLALFFGVGALNFFWETLQILHFFPQLLLCILAIVWIADTMAYLGGYLWGRHLLAPKISPKKTWEGLCIGLMASLIFYIFIFWLLFQQHWLFFVLLSWKLLLVTLITVLISVTGDLVESLLKRLHGFKDSGKLLPGHGGILDRIDSLLGAVPVFFAGLIILL